VKTAASGSLATEGRVKKRTGRKGTATRARVIEAARECISELGYHRASSNEIARQAGITWGVIQYHFGSRESVLLAIVDSAVEELASRLDAVVIAGSTPSERLASVAEIIWSYYASPHYLAYLEIYLNLTRDPAASAEARRRLAEIDAEIAARWHRIAAEVFGSIDALAVERLLFASLRGLAITRWLSDEESDLAEERRLLVEALAPLLGQSQ
jgi:AcrR family transcriptional regulator